MLSDVIELAKIVFQVDDDDESDREDTSRVNTDAVVEQRIASFYGVSGLNDLHRAGSEGENYLDRYLS